jgi:hypothetical protein
MSKQKLNGSTVQQQQSDYLMRKALKEQVEDYEIRARKWKAEYEMMEYAMKVQELKSVYNEFLEKLQKEAEEAYAKLAEQKEETSNAEG